MEQTEMLAELKRMANELRQVGTSLMVFDIFQEKWSLAIIFELCQVDSMRFGQLKNAVTRVTNTMLTNSLRRLEQRGVITRIQYNEIPPHTEYSLTERGRELLPIMFEMVRWEEKGML